MITKVTVEGWKEALYAVAINYTLKLKESEYVE